MAIPEVIPHLQSIPEQIEAVTIENNDWWILSRAGVNRKISGANMLAAISGSISSSAQLGDIIYTMNPSNPTGYVECDNSAYNPATYPAFFALFGYTWGNSAGNFRVPDFRGRSPMGAGTGIEHIAPSPNNPLTPRVVGTYYGLESSTDTDTPTISIGNTVVVGSIAINSFTPTGTVNIGAVTFVGTSAVLTGTVAITDPGHTHDVTTVPVQVAETPGRAVAIDNTYTTTSALTGITAALTMAAYVPAGTIASPTATFTGGLISPTGTVTLATHTHTASSTAVSITNSTVHPVTIVRVLIKIS